MERERCDMRLINQYINNNNNNNHITIKINKKSQAVKIIYISNHIIEYIYQYIYIYKERDRKKKR